MSELINQTRLSDKGELALLWVILNPWTWLLVAGFVGPDLEDRWQHCTHSVANTRWWPTFCMAVDFVVAAIIAPSTGAS